MASPEKVPDASNKNNSEKNNESKPLKTPVQIAMERAERLETVEMEKDMHTDDIEKMKEIAAKNGFDLTKSVTEKEGRIEELTKDSEKEKGTPLKTQAEAAMIRADEIVGDGKTLAQDSLKRENSIQARKESLENELTELQGNRFRFEELKQMDGDMFPEWMSNDDVSATAKKRINAIKSELSVFKISELKNLQDNRRNPDELKLVNKKLFAGGLSGGEMFDVADKRIDTIKKDLRRDNPEGLLKYETEFLQENCRNSDILKQWDEKIFKNDMSDEEIFKAVGKRIGEINRELKIVDPAIALDAELKELQADTEVRSTLRISEIETRLEGIQAGLAATSLYEKELQANNIEIAGGFPEDEDGLKLVEKKYLDSITEQLKNNKAVASEMEALGIKKGGENITKKHCYSLMQQYNKGQLSDNARNFIRKIEPQYFKHILNEVRQNIYTF